MPYYSENREDEWIESHLELPKKGVYVDVGAAHPISASNTAFLRDRGWSGIAIDANPEWEKEWKSPFICAVIGKDPYIHFEFSHGESIWCARKSDAGRKIKTTLLESILNEYKIEKIDFLSIDVEGMEFDVLQTMDLDRHAPSIIIAEYNTKGLPHDYRLKKYLINTGKYRLAFENSVNFIFEARTNPLA